MSNLIYRYLKRGDQVSWEHPVTGKVYDFEVTDTDWNDEWQPVELQLLDDIDYANIVNVSEYSEFSSKGYRRWPYISNRAHKDRYGWGIPENSITLDRLFYTADRKVEETQDGRILADREAIEDFGVVQGDAAYPASVVVPEKAPETQGELSIPSADEANQYRYTSQADFERMFVERMANAIKQDEDHILLPPVLVEMYRRELQDLGYKPYYDAVYFVKFD